MANSIGKLCIRLLILICIVLPTTDISGQERRNYGREWQNLSSFERTLYLGGFQEGAYAALYTVWITTGILLPGENEKKLIDQLALTSRQQVALKQLANQHENKTDIASFGTTAVAAVITNLYSNPANAFIPWDQMVKIALMRLQGVSEDKIQKELEINRRTVTELLKNK